MVDGIRRDQRRNYHRRYPRPILIEPETVSIRSRERRLVTGFNRAARRSYVIVKSPVLIPGDDEYARLPERRIADCLVGCLDQRFASGHAVQWMLRVAIQIVSGYMPIIGLDPRELRRITSVADVFREVCVTLDIPDVDSFQRVREREDFVPRVDAPRQPFDVENTSVVKMESVRRFPHRCFHASRTVIELAGRCS